MLARRRLVSPATAWVLFVLNVVEETARWTTGKIRAMRQLLGAASDHIRSNAPKIDSRELIDVIFEQPCCRIGNLVDRNAKL